MIGEGFGEGAGLVLFECVQLFKEGDEALRIVAGLVHVLDTEVIGFGFGLAGELEEGEGDGELGNLVGAVRGVASLAHDDERNGGDLGVVALGLLAGGVVGDDVGNLVGHDAGELGFLVAVGDEAGVDVEEAAGKSEGVDLVGIDDLDGEREPWRRSF